MINYNEEVLKNKIIFFRPTDPFTWASGLRSPIYCDNRLILGYPELRDDVEEKLGELITTNFENCEVVIGTATAGIPHSSIVAHNLKLPCGYVRSSVKKHGRNNMIEGIDVTNKNVVVVEDLISTGKSVLEVIDILKDNGANVLGVVAIFSYEFTIATERFNEYQLPFYTISNISKLLTYSKENALMTDKEITLVKSFLQNPQTWYEREF